MSAFRVWFTTLLGVLLFAVPARAHWADLAVAEVVLAPDRAAVTLTVPTGLLGRADDDGDGRLSAREVAAHRAWLTETLAEAVRIEAGGRPAALTLEGVVPAGPAAAGGDSHSTLSLSYRYAAPAEDVAMRYALFAPGIDTASCLATIAGPSGTRSLVFTPEAPQHALTGRGPWQTLSSFFLLGVEHIWLGFDHVLFLIALLMMGGGLAYLLKVVTAFTVAHSLTLALATFGLVALPGRLVESMIALSIVYVAAEIFWRRDLKGRWALTLGFGLIHGLGFASVLKELEVAQGALGLSLLGFNAGVEAGQIAIVGAAFLGLGLVRRQRWDLGFRRAVSAGVAAMGLFWFVERAFLTL